MTQPLADGCILSWSAPDEPIKLAELRAALTHANFSEELARDLAPRNAFSRAARELSKERIIKKVEETDDEIRFQFTREFLAGGQYDYEREFDLWLNKETGTVRCENQHMQQVAQELVSNHQATRLPADVTRLIQKIFDSAKSDLVPIRQQGGCYFVPSSATNQQIIANIRVLLCDIGGKLNEWEITARSVETQTTIQQNMFDYLLGLVDEFNKSCESITDASATKTLERRLERHAELRAKLMTHAPLLQGLAAEVSAAIDNSLTSLIASASGGTSLPAPPVQQVA